MITTNHTTYTISWNTKYIKIIIKNVWKGNGGKSTTWRRKWYYAKIKSWMNL